MELEKALAPVLAAEEGKGISKRQIKKLRHKKLNSSDRKAKKLKSQRETRNTNRIQAEAPVYSIANGYRMVKPYVYEFRTYAKARWFDRELLEIFTREFGANSPEYYVSRCNV
ncbi:hypothetical protein CCR75_004998 [Bremia lactucae]|uniref:Uncharacterized protein n=1 Tax=Bremia lactucae TaxID=4779 RepID=A0A976FQT4_BRELC|nr:hypothetical protein CCR75_004998 [Bremia lactucae]